MKVMEMALNSKIIKMSLDLVFKKWTFKKWSFIIYIYIYWIILLTSANCGIYKDHKGPLQTIDSFGLLLTHVEVITASFAQRCQSCLLNNKKIHASESTCIVCPQPGRLIHEPLIWSVLWIHHVEVTFGS